MNWKRMREVFRNPVAWLIAVTIVALLTTCTAMGAPPRTLPHDHSTQGKGGTTISPLTLGEINIGGYTTPYYFLGSAGTTGFHYFRAGSVNAAGTATCTNNVDCNLDMNWTSADGLVQYRRLLFNDGANALTEQYLSGLSGADYSMTATDTGAAAVNIWEWDADLDVAFWHPASNSTTAVFRTSSNGFNIFDPAGNDPGIVFYQDDGATFNAEIGAVGSASTGLRFLQYVHGGPISLQSEDAGGTNRTMLSVDPDGAMVLGDTGITTPTLEINAHSKSGELYPCSAAKTADDSITSDATLSTDSDLSCTGLDSAAYYRFKIFLMVDDSASGGGIQWRFTSATAASWSWEYFPLNTTAQDCTNANACRVGFQDGTTIQDLSNAELGSSGGIITIEGFIFNATQIDFQWAQDTSNASPLVVEEGSYAIYERIQ